MRLGILISGRGSNMAALLSAKKEGSLPNAEIAVVLSNKADAPGLKMAQEHGVETCVVPSRDYKGRRTEFDAAVLDQLAQHQLDGLVLAGFMRVVGAEFVRAYPKGIVNIHPSLLPSFPGLDAQKQAIEWGVKVSGCTVHFVDEEVDTGPIILQRVVDVLDSDDADSLSRRIIAEEHRAIVEAVALWTDGNLTISDRRVIRSITPSRT